MKIAKIFILVIASAAVIRAENPSSSQPAKIICQNQTGYRGLGQPQPESNRKTAVNVTTAYYAQKTNKTFFLYLRKNQKSKDQPAASVIIAYYDHNTKMVPKPNVLTNTKNDQSQPALTLDKDGYLWVFVGTESENEPAHIMKSSKPYDINSFELVAKSRFANPQSWYVDNKGFLLIHTRNQDGCRQLYSTSSPDGLNFSQPKLLAAVDRGHHAVSWKHKNKIALAFNTYVNKKGQNTPTNIYYMETSDLGKNWRNVRRKKVDLPLKKVDNPALVRDYGSQKWLIYPKDLNIDRFGFPTILYIMKREIDSPNRKMSCIWTTARWYGRDWEFSGQIRSDKILDVACLNIDQNRNVRLIGPTQTGPQPDQPGGEIIMWTTETQGRSWFKKTITQNSKFNHNCVRRPVNAHQQFDSFWFDGQPCHSRLYFADNAGNAFVLPTNMTKDFEKPQPLAQPQKNTKTKPAK
ncbi:MAG: BNR-4 repeat-containing protein [Planctomycetota bacterium]|jgi:hypothetical protein